MLLICENLQNYKLYHKVCLSSVYGISDMWWVAHRNHDLSDYPISMEICSSLYWFFYYPLSCLLQSLDLKYQLVCSTWFSQQLYAYQAFSRHHPRYVKKEHCLPKLDYNYDEYQLFPTADGYWRHLLSALASESN